MDVIQKTQQSSDFFDKVINFDILSFLKNAFRFVYDLFDPASQYAHFWFVVRMVIGLVAVFFVFIIAYCIVRLFEIRKKEHEHIHHELEEYAHKHAKKETIPEDSSAPMGPRWRAVLEYLFSDSEADWKLSIMEADSMLDTLMEDLGFKGESFGDKLKSADQEKFPELTKAWEVHNIRNRIAHEGVSFVLSNHEAKRVIAIYEDIFRNYGFI